LVSVIGKDLFAMGPCPLSSNYNGPRTCIKQTNTYMLFMALWMLILLSVLSEVKFNSPDVEMNKNVSIRNRTLLQVYIELKVVPGGPSLQITMGQELASNKLIRTCCSLLYVMSALAFNVILVSL
jgi:hypothetical protein